MKRTKRNCLNRFVVLQLFESEKQVRSADTNEPAPAHPGKRREISSSGCENCTR